MSSKSSERPWGRFRTIHDERGVRIKIIEIDPGEATSVQYHRFRSERIFVVEGELIATVDGAKRTCVRGDVVHIGVYIVHRLENRSERPCRLVEIQMGTPDESDIVRIEDRYGRVPDPQSREEGQRDIEDLIRGGNA